MTPERVFEVDQDKWWHNQLEKLVNGIRAFSDAETGLASSGTSPEHGWGVRKRFEFASAIAEWSLSSAEAAAAWARAIASIADPAECPAYGGLRLTPQLGLFPIGCEPDSGLWEFAHLQTGAPAERASDGKLVLREETGLVFVLLPGGTFAMGAQKADPSKPNYDSRAQGDEGPVHDVTLSPFFLSKYEMTQGQWERFTGRNPSYYKPPGGSAPSLLHPVEQVGWTTCMEACRRLGLELPSEAQWEYGGRGGTTTVWWTGSDRESLLGAVNLADRAAARAGATWLDTQDWPELDDGYGVHAPVDRFRPNPFGLYNVHGNVWEWCRDGYDRGFYSRSPRQDPVADAEGSAVRVDRGGGYDYAAVNARSARRSSASPEYTEGTLGLRPARLITP